MTGTALRALALAGALACLAACNKPHGSEKISLVLVGGSGAEESHARRQLARFMAENPDVSVTYQATPSSATDRHTLYVTWLSAGSEEIDVLNVDVIWPSEFAAAGWLLPLDDLAATSGLPLGDYVEGALAAGRYRGRLYGIPWFIDVGILYYRTDVFARAGLRPPTTYDDVLAGAAAARAQGLPYGFVWQGARYEGLVCNALEYFWGHGGSAFDPEGRPRLESAANVAALRFMVHLVESDASPRAVVTFLEEDARHAFGQGYAGLMRNWPYAYTLMSAADSPVRGKFALSPMPALAGATSAGTLGGGLLAINARTRHPQAAWRLVEFLSRPEALVERAEALGMHPPRRSLYVHPRLLARYPYYRTLSAAFLEARPRPISPLYPSLSEVLQIALSRALTAQATPAEALASAQRKITALLTRDAPG